MPRSHIEHLTGIALLLPTISLLGHQYNSVMSVVSLNYYLLTCLAQLLGSDADGVQMHTRLLDRIQAAMSEMHADIRC